MADRRSELRFSTRNVDDASVLTFEGVLDATTYLETRDAIVKTVLDEPRLAIVDVTRLTVREDPAWAVFTSARWQTFEWPDVPIGLVTAHRNGRNALLRNGIARYIPVFATVESALAGMSVDELRRYRRRARTSMPAKPASIRRCREFIAQWLSAWSRTDFVHVASLVATELVEAVLAVVDTDFALRVETDGSTVSIAVQYISIAEAAGRKPFGGRISGLDLVAANSRAWGTYTTLSNNTIWSVVGPENRF